MRERPILFSAPMVKAMLEGRKTQTRRIVKPQPEGVSTFEGATLPYWHVGGFRTHKTASNPIRCPHGVPGDRLWVRETHSARHGIVEYRADRKDEYGIKFPWGHIYDEATRWTPAIHMFRHHSRITLELTEVRVELLNDISEADAIAEGCSPCTVTASDLADMAISDASPEVKALSKAMGLGTFTAKFEYMMLWDEINGPGSWASNPWVWVVSFSPTKETPKS